MLFSRLTLASTMIHSIHSSSAPFETLRSACVGPLWRWHWNWNWVCCKYQIFVKFNSTSALKRRLSCVYRVDTGKSSSSESDRKLSPRLSALQPRLFISSPQCCRPLHCSLRCVTYGKLWISQYTVCSQNMLWLTFHWSSLWLPAKIVAALFGCTPEWIYGGVSLSKHWWLVWVAVADCWGVLSVISALHVCTIPDTCHSGRNMWRGQDSENGFLWESCSRRLLCIIHAVECVTSSREVCSGPPQGASGHQANPTVSNINSLPIFGILQTYQRTHLLLIICSESFHPESIAHYSHL